VILKQKYDNGAERTYTIVSVEVLENDCATVETKESGQIIVSLNDTPDLWQQLINLGMV